VLNKVVSIIDKTVLITEKADVENIQIHPDFRMFCCMNPHHSSAGKKSLNPILRSKMTEIFVDELDKSKDIIPIVQINLSNLYDAEFVSRITSFYLDVKTKIKNLIIHHGTKKPAIGLRNLVRTLKYVNSALNNQEVTFSPSRALYEALVLNFTTQVDEESQKIIIKMIIEIVFKNKPPNKDNMASLKFSNNVKKENYVIFENYAIKKGKFDPIKKLGADPDWEDKFIMTSTFKILVKTFSSII
jgi:midasin